jgi:hypothetical protein
MANSIADVSVYLERETPASEQVAHGEAGDEAEQRSAALLARSSRRSARDANSAQERARKKERRPAPFGMTV